MAIGQDLIKLGISELVNSGLDYVFGTSGNATAGSHTDAQTRYNMSSGSSSESRAQMRIVPKQLFAIQVVPSNQAIQAFNRSQSDNIFRPLNFLCTSCDRPGFTIDTKEVNQYNRKRLIRGKIRYKPIQITLHDSYGQSDDLWMHLMYYLESCYGDFSFINGRKNTKNMNTSWNNDVVSSPSSFESTGKEWGYRIPNHSAISGNFKNVFDKIHIFEFYGKNCRCHTLINPQIASITPDNKDIAASDHNTITLSVEYEGYSAANPYSTIESNYPLAMVENNLLSLFQSLGFSVRGSFNNDATNDSLFGGLYDTINGLYEALPPSLRGIVRTASDTALGKVNIPFLGNLNNNKVGNILLDPLKAGHSVADAQTRVATGNLNNAVVKLFK